MTWLTKLALLLSLLVASACAFAPPIIRESRRPLMQRLALCGSATSTARSSSSSSLSSEIFLLSFDGTVAQTTEYRIDVGIDLAFAAWSHLKDLTVIASACPDYDEQQDNNNNHEWLRNKMRALSHVLVSRPNVSLSCDYALLARLLMEEQELDAGRSNGSRGKYGSKFHPQTTSSSEEEESEEESSSSSSSSTPQTRPLTVGEIASNWNKGGCLADTVLTKYHVNYKNPLPILQEKLVELVKDKDYGLPEVSDAVMDILETSRGNIFITVGHELDLAMAEKTLSSAKTSIPLEPCIVSVDDEELLLRKNYGEGDGNARIRLLPIGSTNAAVYEDVLKQAPSRSIVYVFESSWHALEQSISLFGDNIPRGNGMARTIFGRDMMLSLNFPTWCSNNDVSSQSGVVVVGAETSQQNEALMNPWTNLVSEDEFSELLSARIIQ